MSDGPLNHKRTTPRVLHAVSAVGIVSAAIAVYAGSFAGRFVFDDHHNLGNGRLRDLFSLSEVLGRGRPVVDYSLALNHAVAGVSPWGYHAVNLAIHVLAALTLFGLVRRTLIRVGEPIHRHFGASSSWLAMTAALLWVVHPLQTQSVTYITQRAESMMGLFYLLTLYCVVRGVDADRPASRSHRSVPWFVLAVIACAMGMGSKAVMVTAPLMVLLYDRCFVATTTTDALRRRWGLYAGLASTWLILYVTGAAGNAWNAIENNTLVGLGIEVAHKQASPVGPVDYALTQLGVVVTYLRLSLWPRPLCLDYGWPISKSFGAIAPPLVAITVLLGVTLWSLRRRGGVGFLGAWFFLILLPTSCFIPISEPLAEHRMYLPLAGVTVLIVTGVYTVVRHLIDPTTPGRASGAVPRNLFATGKICLPVVAIVAIASLGYATNQRNRDYASEPGMWEDVRAKRPGNDRAVEYHGTALIASGRLAEAGPVMREAVALRPDSARARNGLGLTLIAAGLGDQAIEQFREAAELSPDFVDALANLSAALVKRGRMNEATPYFERVLRIDPDHEGARLDFGIALLSKNQLAAAIGQFQAVTELNPNSAMAWRYLGTAMVNTRRFDDAVPALLRSVALTGGTAQTLTSLGFAHSQRKEWDDAIDALRRALMIQPDYPAAHVYLARTFFEMEDFKGATRHFAIVVELQPDNGASHYELGLAMEQRDDLSAASDEFRQALNLEPDLQRAATALDRVQQVLHERGEQP